MTARTFLRIGLSLALVASLTGGCAMVARTSLPQSPVEAGVGIATLSPVSISDDGRYVAFSSYASNLVAGDSNGVADVFVRDRTAGTTERVSIGAAQGNNVSSHPSISADGRYIAYRSAASNLVAADNNLADDVFVRDRILGTTTRVSLSTIGAQGNGGSDAPSISDDGRYVAFSSVASNLVGGDTNGVEDIFVRDRMTTTTTRSSLNVFGTESAGGSVFPAISGDGRYVAFESAADDLLLPGVDTNGLSDVFVRDRIAATTTRVSVGDDESEGNGPSIRAAISGTGRYVTFTSYATGLVPGDGNGQPDVFVRDVQLGVTERVSIATGGGQATLPSFGGSVSDSGRYVAFASEGTLVPGDTNNVRDVFVRDRTANTTTRVSVQTGGGQAGGGTSQSPMISGDGTAVAFQSGATNLVTDDTNDALDAFAHRLSTQVTERVSVAANQANAASKDPSVSDNGRYVAFTSDATNLVPRDTNLVGDVFVRDHLTGAVERVSVNSNGLQGNGGSQQPAISGDGRFVAFTSASTNLVTPDPNGFEDVFVHDRITGNTEIVSVDSNGVPAQGRSSSPSITDTGLHVAFVSDASNLVVGDTNGESDVFLRYRPGSSTTKVSRDTLGGPSDGPSGAPTISAGGQYIAFESGATNIVANDTNGAWDVFRRDIVSGSTVRVSVSTLLDEGNQNSSSPTISDDGDVVAFSSLASNLAPNDTNGTWDVFVRKLTCTGAFCIVPTSAVSVASGSSVAFGGSQPSISDDGRFVGFSSGSSGLVHGDTNGLSDIYVRDRTTSRTTRVDTAIFLDQAIGGDSEAPAISGDGRTVAFESAATNLTGDDTNGVKDVFLRAQPVPTVTNVSPNNHPAGGPGFPVTITGTNFLPNAQVRFSNSNITAVVNTLTDTTITATITIPPGTAAGPVDVLVGNIGTGPGTNFGAMGRCTACLTVT